MSGAIAALSVTGSALVVVVVTFDSGTFRGFLSAGPIGSASPSSIRGVSLIAVGSSAGALRDMEFTFSGTAPAIPSRLVVTSAAGVRTFLRADITLIGGSNEGWFMGDGSNDVWTASDEGQSRIVTLIY